MKKLIGNEISQNKTFENNTINLNFFSQMCTCFQQLNKQSSYRIDKKRDKKGDIQSCRKCFLKNLKKGINNKSKIKSKMILHRSQSKQPRNEKNLNKNELTAYYDFAQKIQQKEKDLSFLLKKSTKKIKNFFSPILKSLKLKRDVLLQNINSNFQKEKQKLDKLKIQLDLIKKKIKPKGIQKSRKSSKKSLKTYMKDVQINLHKIDLKSLIFPEVSSEIFCRIMNRTYDDFWIEFRKFGTQSSKSDLNRPKMDYNFINKANNPIKETANSNHYKSKASTQKPQKFFLIKQFDEDFKEFRNQREAVVLDELTTNEFKKKLGKLKDILKKKKKKQKNKANKKQILKQYDSLLDTREHNLLFDQINNQVQQSKNQRSW